MISLLRAWVEGEERVSHANAAKRLTRQGHPMSRQTVQRLCGQHKIRSPCFTDQELDREVERCIMSSGGVMGRVMMTAKLENKGVRAAEKRVGESLARVHPPYHLARQRGTDKQMNPSSYHAAWFGYNNHMDQNEKLAEFGITVVMCIDGHSDFIPAYSVMPKKNCLTIYDEVFRVAVEKYGLWEQVIVDHGSNIRTITTVSDYIRLPLEGREFNLILYAQHKLRLECPNLSASRLPYRQVQSTKNNKIERMWVEVNNRIGYPIKYCLLNMEEVYGVKRDCPEHLFAFSYVGGEVFRTGLTDFVLTWNNHKVSGKGKPNSYVEQRQNGVVNPDSLVSGEEMGKLYDAASGNTLTRPSLMGSDPLFTSPSLLQKRHQLFWPTVFQKIGSLEDIFGATVNHNYAPLQKCILMFLDMNVTLLSE